MVYCRYGATVAREAHNLDIGRVRLPHLPFARQPREGKVVAVGCGAAKGTSPDGTLSLMGARR